MTSVGKVPHEELPLDRGVEPRLSRGLPAPRSTQALLVRGARPRQWLKNLLVFMAPAAAGVLGEWHTALRVIGAFDKLQKEFEEEIGKAVLNEMLKAIRKLEALSVAM